MFLSKWWKEWIWNTDQEESEERKSNKFRFAICHDKKFIEERGYKKVSLYMGDNGVIIIVPEEES